MRRTIALVKQIISMQLWAQELGYGIPLAFMLMEIHEDKDTKTKNHDSEASQCNLNFYQAEKDFGIDPKFIHVDKDYAEISPAKVRIPQWWSKLEEIEKDGLLLVLLE